MIIIIIILRRSTWWMCLRHRQHWLKLSVSVDQRVFCVHSISVAPHRFAFLQERPDALLTVPQGQVLQHGGGSRGVGCVRPRVICLWNTAFPRATTADCSHTPAGPRPASPAPAAPPEPPYWPTHAAERPEPRRGGPSTASPLQPGHRAHLHLHLWPWSTKPVIRVNFVKFRLIHHLKAE